MQINLEEIRRISIEKEKENQDFKTFIKTIPIKEIDEHVHSLNEEVSKQIDCTKCGNCCKVLEPPVTAEEVQVLSDVKNTTEEEFTQNYLATEPGSAITYLKKQPCIFLEGNVCSIYQKRPFSCADYPHLHHPHIKYRWRSVMTNYKLCPIVFNVIELLKSRLQFKS